MAKMRASKIGLYAASNGQLRKDVRAFQDSRGFRGEEALAHDVENRSLDIFRTEAAFHRGFWNPPETANFDGGDAPVLCVDYNLSRCALYHAPAGFRDRIRPPAEDASLRAAFAPNRPASLVVEHVDGAGLICLRHILTNSIIRLGGEAGVS